MKKKYETPTLQTETFDMEDVITASGTGGQIQTVGNGMEVLLGNLAGMSGQ